LATLAATRTSHLVDNGHQTANALVSGYHLAFEVAAIIVAAGVILAIVGLRRRGTQLGLN
jgi:NADH:ubiquinone oxidoreductase subunit 6 (subunit J)